MSAPLRRGFAVPALLLVFALSACGGHNDEFPDASKPATAEQLESEPGAPKATGDVALDGLNWFNFRRLQAGLPSVLNDPFLKISAQGHSDYQKTNKVIDHNQDSTLPGFTGVGPKDRMIAAGYPFVADAGQEYGEVISAINSKSGFYMAHALMTAISHRFVIFEPTFVDAGAGAATVTDGVTYFTVDFAAGNNFGPGIIQGTVVTYPFANQQQVPINFFSNQEQPDPVPEKDEVGFPISVHANVTDDLEVTTFRVTPRNGGALPVTPVIYNPQHSAAAIIPMSPLISNTTYDVQFIGTAGGTTVNRSWAFTTR